MSVRVRNVSPFCIGIDVPGVGHVKHGEEVDVPEWGGKILLRCMTGKDLAAYNKSMLDIKGGTATYNPTNGLAKLLARAICDGEGRRVFSEADIDELGNKDGQVLERIAKVARRLNRLDGESADDLKKNSPPTTASASIAATPLPSAEPIAS